jgi:fumarylacetoacetase
MNGSAPRSGVAIGEHIVDLEAALAAGLFDGAAKPPSKPRGGQLNAFFELGRSPRGLASSACWNCSRRQQPGKIEAQGAKLLPLAADCQMHLPAKINDYTDFYVGIEHAQNVGKLFRPDNPLLPNYKYVPIGYHGRASTIRPSGTDVRRPKGQTLPAGQSEPTFGPCAPGLRTGTGHLDRPGQRHGRRHRHW